MHITPRRGGGGGGGAGGGGGGGNEEKGVCRRTRLARVGAEDEWAGNAFTYGRREEPSALGYKSSALRPGIFPVEFRHPPLPQSATISPFRFLTHTHSQHYVHIICIYIST